MFEDEFRKMIKINELLQNIERKSLKSLVYIYNKSFKFHTICSLSQSEHLNPNPR